jgi:hypothetical protein
MILKSAPLISCVSPRIPTIFCIKTACRQFLSSRFFTAPDDLNRLRSGTDSTVPVPAGAVEKRVKKRVIKKRVNP